MTARTVFFVVACVGALAGSCMIDIIAGHPIRWAFNAAHVAIICPSVYYGPSLVRRLLEALR